MPELVTNRLRLRQWQDADLGPFAALNADPEVMRYFPERPTRARSDEFAARIRAAIDRKGWGLWVVDVVAGPSFIGFTGLNPARFTAHITPALKCLLAGSRRNRSSAVSAASGFTHHGPP